MNKLYNGFNFGPKLLSLFLLICFAQETNFAQSITFTEIPEATENSPLIVRGEIQGAGTPEMVYFGYKSSTETGYKIIEAELSGSSFKVVIPAAEVKAPFVEYYIQYNDMQGNTGFYPDDYQNSSVPARIMVSAGPEFSGDVIMLNPIDNQNVLDEDFFISYSCFRLPDEINVQESKVIINAVDVTEQSFISDNLISFYNEINPGILKPGRNIIEVVFYNHDGKKAFSKSNDFVLLPDKSIPGSVTEFSYSADFYAEGINDNYKGVNTWENIFSGNINGKYGDFNFESDFYITSNEKRYTQPQNRYYAGIHSRYGDLLLGDHIPSYPSLIYSGKRLRGASANLYLGFFEMRVSYGQVTRATEGRLLEVYQTNDTPLEPGIIPVDSTQFGGSFARVVSGSYSRDMLLVRPVFNFTDNTSLAFTYLHSKDDPHSIVFASRPKENLVFGPDLNLSFDRNRIKFNGSAYISLINTDISDGTIQDSLVENLFNDNEFINGDPDEINRYKHIIDNFITVNQYLGPLSLTKLGSFASDLRLELNYFSNSFSVAYIYRGNDYNSFGNPFMRKDVAGFNFYDRIRLFNNKLFVNLNYEMLNDNLQDTKINTTDITNINASVSYMPRNEFPDLTVGIKTTQNQNDAVPEQDDYQMLLVDDFTTRYFLQGTKRFKGVYHHNLSLSFSYTGRDDKTYRNSDTKVLNSTAGLSTKWSNSFSTYSGASVNNSDSPSGMLTYTRLVVSGKWLWFEETLEFNVKVSPTIGNLKRTGFEMYGSYNFTPQFSLAYQLRYFTDYDEFNSSVAGLSLKYSI